LTTSPKKRDPARRGASDRRHVDPVEYDFHAKRSWAWRKVEALGRSAKKEEVQLAALREFLKRTDPEPKSADELDTLKAELEAAQRRGLTVNIAIVTGSASSGNGHGAHAVREPAPDSGEIRIVSGNGGGA
jgi:hypothetical protein